MKLLLRERDVLELLKAFRSLSVVKAETFVGGGDL